MASFFELVNITVDGSEPVLVRTPSYLHNLSATLKNVDARWAIYCSLFTNFHFVCCGFCSVLETYAKWQLVLRYLPYLSDDFTSAYYAFTLATTGQHWWRLITMGSFELFNCIFPHRKWTRGEICQLHFPSSRCNVHSFGSPIYKFHPGSLHQGMHDFTTARYNTHAPRVSNEFTYIYS